MNANTKFVIDGSWQIILKDLGIPAAEVLTRAGLATDLFARENASLNVPEYFRFWKALEESTDDPVFPVTLCRNLSTEAFHPLFFAALSSPNLNVALKRIQKYKTLVGPLKLDFTIKDDGTTVSFNPMLADFPLPNWFAKMELGFIVQLTRLATREEIKPVRVIAPLPWEPIGGYVDFFGIRPELGDSVEVTIAVEDANRPFLTENKKMWQFFEPELRARLKDMQAEDTIARRVQASLHELLPTGLCSVDDVAGKLAMSKRSLQRKLKEERTSFQEQLDATREKLARYYLDQSNIPLPEIAFLLGYEEPSSFARAFRQWTGESPGKLRKVI